MTTTTTQAVDFVPDAAVAAIVKHPDNPRHDVGDVSDLAASIKDQGVLEPLVVIPFDDLPEDLATGPRRKSTQWALIAGHRRLAAAREAKEKTVPVIVRRDLVTRGEQIAAMVVENQHRQDLSPVEEGEAYQLLLDVGDLSTQAEVAKAVGMPRQRVSSRLRLLSLNDGAREKVQAGQVSLEDAATAASFAGDEQWGERVEAALGTANFAITVQHARDAQQREKDARAFGTTLEQEHGAVRLATDPFVGDELDPSLSLVDDLPGRPWVAYRPVTEQWPALLKFHQQTGCTSLAYWLDKHGVVLFCTNPGYHVDEDGAPHETDDQRAIREAREKEQAEWRERTEKRNAATAVRRAAVRDWVATATLEQTAPLLRTAPNALTHLTYDYRDGTEALADLCGVDVRVLDQAAVDAALAKVPAASLPAMWWAMAHTCDEVRLSGGICRTGSVEEEYVRELTDVVGYQWSDFERVDLDLDEDGYHRQPDADADDDLGQDDDGDAVEDGAA